MNKLSYSKSNTSFTAAETCSEEFCSAEKYFMNYKLLLLVGITVVISIFALLNIIIAVIGIVSIIIIAVIHNILNINVNKSPKKLSLIRP